MPHVVVCTRMSQRDLVTGILRQHVLPHLLLCALVRMMVNNTNTKYDAHTAVRVGDNCICKVNRSVASTNKNHMHSTLLLKSFKSDLSDITFPAYDPQMHTKNVKLKENVQLSYTSKQLKISKFVEYKKLAAYFLSLMSSLLMKSLASSDTLSQTSSSKS